MNFDVVVLTEIGDYLLKTEEDYQWTENGLKITQAYLVNEDGLAQRVQAEETLVTGNALQAIQKGDFEEEIQ